jgi:hypothetical protein
VCGGFDMAGGRKDLIALIINDIFTGRKFFWTPVFLVDTMSTRFFSP